jgi:hypothetical protein
MMIVAFIIDSPVIRQILDHLRGLAHVPPGRTGGEGRAGSGRMSAVPRGTGTPASTLARDLGMEFPAIHLHI